MNEGWTTKDIARARENYLRMSKETREAIKRRKHRPVWMDALKRKKTRPIPKD